MYAGDGNASGGFPGLIFTPVHIERPGWDLVAE
jgi:hypothetical protein